MSLFVAVLFVTFIGSRAMSLMPEFYKKKKAAGYVARLVTGYGELELGLAKCVGMALAYKRNPPLDRQDRYIHRIRYENFAIKLVFRLGRGEKRRIADCAKIIRPPYSSHGFQSELDETLNAMRACLSIRNLFAHCTWDQTKKHGLFFINLEEVAKIPKKIGSDYPSPRKYKVTSGRRRLFYAYSPPIGLFSGRLCSQS